MQEAARSQLLAPVSGVPSSRRSGPSESENLRKLSEFAQENPLANRLLANPEIVAERLPGYDGAEDTAPTTHINRNEHSVSAPPVSAAGRHLSTPVRTIEHPPPTTGLPPSTANVAPTQPRASGTPRHPDLRFRVCSTPQKTPHPYSKYAFLEDIAWVENEISRFRDEFFFHF